MKIWVIRQGYLHRIKITSCGRPLRGDLPQDIRGEVKANFHAVLNEAMKNNPLFDSELGRFKVVEFVVPFKFINPFRRSLDSLLT